MSRPRKQVLGSKLVRQQRLTLGYKGPDVHSRGLDPEAEAFSHGIARAGAE